MTGTGALSARGLARLAWLPFVLLIPLSLYAFWDTYIFRASGVYFPWEHLHAFPAAAWMLVIAVQIVLIARGKRAAHRRVGALLWPLALLMVLTTAIVAWDAFSASSRSDFSYYILADRFFLTGFFTAFTAAALVLRKRPDLHARLMISGSVPLFDPVLNRISDNFIGWPYVTGVHQWISFAAMDALLAFLAARDRRTGKPPVFAIALVLLIVGQAAVLLGWDSAAWRAVADGFGALPLGGIPGTFVD